MKTTLEEFETPLTASTVLGLFLAALLGGLGAAFLLPAWAPALAGSLDGEMKAAWFLSRSSGLMAWTLTWASMLLGLLLGTRWAKRWPGPQAAFALHQHTSLLGLAFALFHALVLLGDRYLAVPAWSLAVPFALPATVRWAGGLGQLAFFIAAAVASSFWMRGRLGAKAWRALHSASFIAFALALAHGIAAGTDSARPWVRWLYLLSAGSVLFPTLVRLLGRLLPQPRRTIKESLP
jgi:predicted ferric reductase